MKKGNRKATEEIIIKYINKIIPGSGNEDIYKKFFSDMNDKEFDDWIKRLDSGEEELFIVAPNLQSERMTVERNLAIGKELGVEFMQRIYIKENKDMPAYLTNLPYLVCDVNFKRVSQHLRNKISTAKNTRSIDRLTGQPTGKASKTTTISYPELQILLGLGLDKTAEELIKYRGGDIRGLSNMLESINKQGGVSLGDLNKTPTKVKSTQSLKTILTCMHLSSTL